MPRRLTLAHALSTGQPNLPIQIHSENPPALPVTRKGKGGRLLHRPQQAHPAGTVVNFRTAVLTGRSQISVTPGNDAPLRGVRVPDLQTRQHAFAVLLDVVCPFVTFQNCLRARNHIKPSM